MWQNDLAGTRFEGPKEAYIELKMRAQRAIQAGDNQGNDVRSLVVRLRDETGNVLFEGTLKDAARLQINGQVFLPRQDV